MLLITCPWCGEREESEFSYGHEAHIKRPENPDQCSDAEWANYLFMRKNIKGPQLERWSHTAGCRRWFNVARNTHSNEILAIYKMGEQAPKDVMALINGAKKR